MRILITNARLVDGTGAPARPGELLVEGDHLAAVFEVRGLPAPDRVIDAGGGVVAPGFIDVHSHGDFVLPAEPDAEPKVRQGITTEVVGNCGLGLVPANDRVQDMYRRYGQLFGATGVAICSEDLEAYRRRLESVGVAVNVACLVPHGNVRCAVVGLSERPPTPSEMQAMEDLVDEEMARGAFGLSTGLVYPPGAYAETEELVRLAWVAAEAGGIYATHIRDEGSRLEDAIEEALEIGRRASAAVQISHHKASGRHNWGKVKWTLARLGEARAEGLVVHSDMYPYTAGSTMLAALVLPLWVFSAADPQAVLERLADPGLRPRIVRDARRRLEDLIVLPGFLDALPKAPFVPAVERRMSDLVVIGSVKRQKRYEGKTLREVAHMRGQPLIDALLDLLVEEDAAVTAHVHVLSEEDVRTVLADPFTMFGTDGMPTLEGKPHPRTYGTYPRALEHYALRLGLFSLEGAIHKATALPAGKLGLQDRGVLREGAKADLVAFRPEGLRDRATYASPRRFPAGIEHVLVSGRPVIEEGRATGERPGRVLVRAPRSRGRTGLAAGMGAG